MNSLKHLDLKSVPCPLNVVKIKLALEKLSKNEQLIVELDKGEPEEMVLNLSLIHISDPRDRTRSRMPSSA